MIGNLKIRSALISVYHKKGLDSLVAQLQQQGVVIYSTGGTAQYIEKLGADVQEVSDLTGYPSILGGRVKTLHPKVHGGILARRDISSDKEELGTYEIPEIDLVVVDLYPFEETVASGASEEEIIEKIDIGGIALIRAAAKNFAHVCCIPSADYYAELGHLLETQGGSLSWAQRKMFAAAAFDISSHYDTQIHTYLAEEGGNFKISIQEERPLRYGENPHQKAWYYGKLEAQFTQVHGKALSYNNLVDIEGALELVSEFDTPAFAIIKHTNPCGCAVGPDMLGNWKRALAGDPISAFGGILACNGEINAEIAQEIHKLFFEVLIAKDFSEEAFSLLSQKKKRILLKQHSELPKDKRVRKLLNGFLVQEKDTLNSSIEALEVKTSRKPTAQGIEDALFGEKVCKHLKSNAIAIVHKGQLIGSGVGQTSRIDALKQAINKAHTHGFEVKGATLISDAFFPFSDSVEFAHQHGIETVVQPGGSMRDDQTINFCENHDMCLIFTGIRHFKH